MKSEKIAKFEKLVSDKKSGWLEKALWREENYAWLEKSALIAVKILSSLDEQKINQRELAEKMSVSAQYINKIVKGSENLSLETISKLETALGIQLIEIPGSIEADKNASIKSEISAEVNEKKEPYRQKKNS